MGQSIAGAWVAGAVMVALSLGVLTVVDRADDQSMVATPTLAQDDETLRNDFVEIIIDDDGRDAHHHSIRPVAAPSM